MSERRALIRPQIRKALLWGLPALALLYAAYATTVYLELEAAFRTQTQQLATRVFSDLMRLAPPLSRAQVEGALKVRAYAFTSNGPRLTFTPRPPDYPAHLLPEEHVQRAWHAEPSELTLELQFGGTRATDPLESIRVPTGGGDAPESGSYRDEFFLEPELIATFARGGGEGGNELREPLAFDAIPATIWHAVIAAEDPRFKDHFGLDPRGIARALLVNLRQLRLAQGGSTITQQLVKILLGRRDKNIFRKATEILLAFVLEARFSKEEILERYLNQVDLGQVGVFAVHGVAEAAQLFFGRSVDELNALEGAMIAGMIRNVLFYNPHRHAERALERARWVIQRMAETGTISEEEAADAVKLPIRLVPPPTAVNKAPYFVDFVRAEMLRALRDQGPRLPEAEIFSGGLRIYTSLDSLTNQAAQAAVADGLAKLEQQLKLPPEERLEGALAAVDHSTGLIRALVGGRSYAQSTFNRILNMRRQVGSTFKPIVYLAAFARGRDVQGRAYGPAYPVEDATWKLVFDHGRQSWAPRNYEKTFLGWTNLRMALAHSVNTVAARLGWDVGIANIAQVARALGIVSPLPEVPSLTLGVAELSPVELLQAYATIANHGSQDDLSAIRAVTKPDGSLFMRYEHHPREVVDPGACDLLTDMMTSVFTEGTARAAESTGFDRPAAGKTGTTSEYRDAWFAGYTPKLTAVVWVGLDVPRPAESKARLRITGAGAALPIWARFMSEAHRADPPAPFPESPHLIESQVDRHTGLRSQLNCPPGNVVSEKYNRRFEPEGASCELLEPASLPRVVTEGEAAAPGPR